ncbi:MAG: hypothetical protein U0175_31010 [Caldilineaceae bacterium]
MPNKLPIIKVVGVSGGGKSTLVKALRNAGYDARPVSQEHSNVPDLWKQFEFPKVLIFLDVSLAAQKERRPDNDWTEAARQEELQRLAHAISHSDLRIDTSQLAPAQVAQVALAFLNAQNISQAKEPLPPVKATGSASQTSY